MAGNALGTGFRKRQVFMAGPAIHALMLAAEFKTGFIMIETGRVRPCVFPQIRLNFPGIRRVAIPAIDLQRRPVRVLRKEAGSAAQKKNYLWQTMHSKFSNLYCTKVRPPFVISL